MNEGTSIGSNGLLKTEKKHRSLSMPEARVTNLKSPVAESSTAGLYELFSML